MCPGPFETLPGRIPRLLHRPATRTQAREPHSGLGMSPRGTRLAPLAAGRGPQHQPHVVLRATAPRIIRPGVSCQRAIPPSNGTTRSRPHRPSTWIVGQAGQRDRGGPRRATSRCIRALPRNRRAGSVPGRMMNRHVPGLAARALTVRVSRPVCFRQSAGSLPSMGGGAQGAASPRSARSTWAQL
jgi:hypothetical protein